MVGSVFDAQIAILEYKSIICAGYTAVLHIHTAVEEVVLKVWFVSWPEELIFVLR